MIHVVFAFIPSAFNQSVSTPDMFAFAHLLDMLSVLVVFVVLPHHPKAKTKSAPHHKHNGDILNRHGVVSFLLVLRNEISLARLSNLCNHESKQTFRESCTSSRTSESVAVGLFIIE